MNKHVVKTDSKTKNNIIWVTVSFVALVVCLGLIFAVNMGVFKSEFEKKCTDGIAFSDGVSFTCDDIKQMGLEDVYIRNEIVKHGKTLFQKGTAKEVQAGKDNRFYCLSAEETWNHIGELRCVVFKYESIGRDERNLFINEKKDYRTGFVVYMPGQNAVWDDESWKVAQQIFIDSNSSSLIGLCGVITTYQGHPQIKRSVEDGYLLGDNLKVFEIVNGEPLYAYKCSYSNGDLLSGTGLVEGYKMNIYDNDALNDYALRPL